MSTRLGKAVKFGRKLLNLLVLASTWVVTANWVFAAGLPAVIDPGQETTPEIPSLPGEVFMVPPLKDRPLGVDEGDRLFVKSISLRSAVDRPELGIRLEEVRELVEKLRFMGQKLDSELAEGFTKDELEHGAKLLRQLVDDPSQLDTSKEFIVETLVSEMRFKMRERWLTIGNLQQIADEVTRYYRSKGLILAQAYLPAQTVSDGEVVIQVIEGMIGNVIVQNNQRYTDAQIIRPFEQSRGKPAFKHAVESALLQLSDYPGLSVFGVFQPGKEVGSADLLLKVRQEKRYEAEIRFDNTGSAFTGENRLHLSYTNNNLSRSADALNVRLMQSLNPNNSVYGALNYQRPVFDRHNQLIFAVSHNAYELGDVLADNELDGTNDMASIAWRHSFVRSRTANNYNVISLKRKSTELSEPIPQSDELTILSLEYGFDAFDFRYAGVNLGWLKISQGLKALGAVENPDSPSRTGNSGEKAGADFSKLEVRYDRLQTISRDQSLLMSLYAHYSNDLLTSTEQMTVGGAGSVRAYPVAEFLIDRGYFLSLEWIIKAPGISQVPVAGSTWGQVLQYAVFIDAAGGQRNDPLTNEVPSVFVSGYGFGFRINLKGFTASVDLATPLSDEVASNGKNSQVLFKLDYHF